MKKIIKGIVTISAMGVLVFGATQAFFSDTETSTGNTFTAGSIDLSLGSRFSSTNNGSGSFSLESNNNGRVLYTFNDLKPGDFGQGVFDVQVTSNEAYLCAQSILDSTPENGIVDPEVDAGDNTGGPSGGELQDYLQIAIFYDADGNGVWDSGEPLNVNQSTGDSNGFTVQEVADLGWISAADTTSPNTWLTQGSIQPNTQYSAGFMYCFGNFALDGSCSGEGVEANDAQTDQIVGGIEFYAVQTRNNPGFKCTDMNPLNEEVLGTWSSVDTDSEGGSTGKEWFAKAKVQEPNPASDFELQVGTEDTNPINFSTSDTVWTDGKSESFTLTYDGSGNATLEVDGHPTTTFVVGTGTYGRIGVNLRAPVNATTTVDNLSLDLGTLSTTTLSATNELKSITFSGVDLSGGFVLTGNITFDWDTLTSNGENQKVQFSID